MKGGLRFGYINSILRHAPKPRYFSAGLESSFGSVIEDSIDTDSELFKVCRITPLTIDKGKPKSSRETCSRFARKG